MRRRGPEGKEGETENNRDDYKHNTCYICMKLPKHRANTSQQREFNKS